MKTLVLPLVALTALCGVSCESIHSRSHTVSSTGNGIGKFPSVKNLFAARGEKFKKQERKPSQEEKPALAASSKAPAKARTNPGLSKIVASTQSASSKKPAEVTKDYRQTGQTYQGKASWYEIRCNGGTHTASGETLNDYANTAAHKTLPMGTHVKVTNLANGKEAVVRINDRGPYIAGRIIDVTKGVAEDLDFINRGVCPVKVEIVEPMPERIRTSRRPQADRIE